MVKLNGHKPGIGEDEQPDGYARSNRVFMHAAMICHGGQNEGWKVENGLVFIEWKLRESRTWRALAHSVAVT